MNQNFRKMGLFLAVVLLFAALALPAAASTPVEVNLTVHQRFESNVPANMASTFTYLLTPLEATNPMPSSMNAAGSTAAGYTFTITGTTEVQIGPMWFDTLGTYSYVLRVVASDADGYTYDERVYRIDVHVMNDTPGNLSASNLTAIVTVYEGLDGAAVKVDEMLFEHRYERELPTEAPTQAPTAPATVPPAQPAGPPAPPSTFDGGMTMLALITLASGSAMAVALKKKKS